MHVFANLVTFMDFINQDILNGNNLEICHEFAKFAYISLPNISDVLYAYLFTVAACGNTA